MSIQLNEHNMLRFMVMVALEPSTEVPIKSMLSQKDAQRILLACRGVRGLAYARMEPILKPRWKEIASAVEVEFYKNLSEEDFYVSFNSVSNGNASSWARRWAASVSQFLQTNEKAARFVCRKYPEIGDILNRAKSGGHSQDGQRLRYMLIVRRPVLDRLIDEMVKDGVADPRIAANDAKVTKISLDGEVIDIPATPEAFKKCLDERREMYSWDALTTELYLNDDGEKRRTVLFYDRSK